MNTITRLQLGALLLSTLGCGGDSATSSDDFPNGIRHVVLVSLDTLRADYLGCYGHEFVQSPAMDRVAGEGVKFTQCISTAPTTLASHTSLFTGKYPHTHGVPRNGYQVSGDNVMLPEILQDQGFRTAGVVGAAPLDTDVNFHQGFDEYDADFSVTEGLREGIYQRPANEVTDLALAWIDRRPEGVDDRFFLFLHYYDIHAPYTFPEPFAGMYAEDEQPIDTSVEFLAALRTRLSAEGRAPGERGGGRAREEGFAERLNQRQGPALADARAMVAEYAAGITWTDHQLGRFLDGLRERELMDETLLVITADHGETLHEHSNTFNHGLSVYDSESHIPLLLRFPGGAFAGTEVEDLVSNIDVLPTLLGLMDLGAPKGIEGIDMGRTLRGEALEREPVFTEATKPFSIPLFNEDPIWKNRGKFQCVRSETHKYMFRLPDQKYRLYDLESDPREANNLLAGNGELDTGVRDELDRALRHWRDDAKPLGGDMTMSEEQLKALDALGYAGKDEQQ